MNEELLKRISDLEFRLNKLEKSDRFVFEKDIQMMNGRNFIFAKGQDEGDGTQLGTAATQRLGFWGVFPTTQPTSADFATPSFITLGGTYSESDINTNFSRISSAFDDLVGILVTMGLRGS